MKALILFGESIQKETESWFPDATEYVHQDIIQFESEPYDLEKEEYYDVILVLHSLNKMIPEKVLPVIEKVYKYLRTGGEIWAYTPSFEWIAKQSFIENPSPVLHYQLFGTVNSPNRSVYNLEWLRALIVQAGFTPRVSTQDKYKIQLAGDGKTKEPNEITMVQNAVVGWKVGTKSLIEKEVNDDPITAID